MSTRSLATRENHAHAESLASLGFGSFELNNRKTVGVREEFLDLGLVANGFRSCTLVNLHAQGTVLEGDRELRLIGLTGLGQYREIFGHCLFLFYLPRIRGFLVKIRRKYSNYSFQEPKSTSCGRGPSSEKLKPILAQAPTLRLDHDHTSMVAALAF